MQDSRYTTNKQQFPQQKLREIVDDILKIARNKGASHAESKISMSRGFDLTVRQDHLENLLDQNSQEIGISVYFGKRHGAATTTDLSKTSIVKTIDKACYIAKYTSEDKFAGLADQDLLAFDYPDLALYYPWDITIEEATRIARHCERSGFTYSKRHGNKITNSEGAAFNYLQSYFVYVNSLGFVGSYPSSIYAYNCALVAQVASDMQREDSYTVARNPSKLLSPERIGREAAERAIKRLHAREIKTTHCPVLFTPRAAKSLIGSFIGAISGDNLYRKESFLLGMRGKRVFPDWVKIDERPHLRGGLNSAPFDVEGVRTMPRTLVKDGCIKDYVLDSYSARKLKLRSTGNCGGVRNLFVSNLELSFNELVKALDCGLIVTEEMGQGINVITGDYSRGVFGFWVEGGKIKYPVQGITAAGNLKTMYKNIAAIGNDVDHRGNIHVGSILVADMVVAGS